MSDTTTDPTPRISPWFDEHPAPFHLALSWYRLGLAEDAIQHATEAGLDDPLYKQVQALRADVWNKLWDHCRGDNGYHSTSILNEALAHARQWMKDTVLP